MTEVEPTPEELDQIDRQLGRVLLICNVAGALLGLYVMWDLVKDSPQIAEVRVQVKHWWAQNVGKQLAHRHWLRKEEAKTVFEAIQVVDSQGRLHDIDE